MATKVDSAFKQADRSAGKIAQYAVLSLFAILTLGPLYVAFVAGLKTNAQLLNDPFGLPNKYIWSNYTDVLTGSSFWRQSLNSILIMLATTLLVLALASTAAFVFALFTFRGR